VHHRPARPPLSARVAGALTRWGLLLRAFLRVRTGRLVLAGVVTATVTGLVLALPVVSSGSELSAVFRDSSSDAPPSTVEDPVFTMPDGGQAPAPDTSAAVPDTATTAPATSATADAATPSSTSAGSSAPAPKSSASPASPASSASSASSSDGAPSSSSGAPPSSTAAGTPSADEAPPSVTAPGPSPTDELLAVLDRTRAVAGCDPLSPDGDLTDAAREHSATMRDEDFLGLVDDDGDSVLDEEDARAGWVARGARSPVDVVNGWLAEGDAAALQDCSLTVVGIGRAGDDDDAWWTLLLA
jgi:uncharacterized protein YkwD